MATQRARGPLLASRYVGLAEPAARAEEPRVLPFVARPRPAEPDPWHAGDHARGNFWLVRRRTA